MLAEGGGEQLALAFKGPRVVFFIVRDKLLYLLYLFRFFSLFHSFDQPTLLVSCLIMASMSFRGSLLVRTP